MIELKDGYIEVKYNGYTGIAYGYSSFSVRDPQGKEIFHTEFTTNEIKTQEEALKYLKDTLVIIGRLAQPQTEEKAPEKEEPPVMCDYVRGLIDAWNVARNLTSPETGGMYENDKKIVFGYTSSDKILRTLSAQEALAKFERWQNYKYDIQPGDEVVFETMEKRTIKCVITCIYGDKYGYVDEDGHCGAFDGICFEKTGKKYPSINHIIDELAGRL